MNTTDIHGPPEAGDPGLRRREDAVKSDESKRSDTPAFRGKLVLFGAQRRPAQSGVVEILKMNPDGTEVESVLKLENAGFMTGRISPDGRRLAFGTTTRDEKRSECWIWDAGGRHKLPVDAVPRAWSPDGAFLACFRPREQDGWESLAVEVATGETQALAIPTEDLVEDWSPDGEYLSVMAGNREHVFERADKEVYPLRQIDLLTVGGSRRQRITNEPLLDNIWSRFSPDGSLVAHDQRRHVPGTVLIYYVVRKRNGDDPVEVLRGDKLDENLRDVPSFPSYPYYWWPHGAPCWSPDGTRLAACLNNPYCRRPADDFHFALVFVTPEGQITDRLDLQELGIAFVCEIDWK